MTKQGARRFPGGPLFPFLALLAALALPTAAQDLKSATSPDGQLEFRIFLAQQDDTALFRLAYQIWFRGQRLLDTSFMGFDIWEQEPLLGENVGLIASSTEAKPEYNGLTGRYLQNGSLGRALSVETRIYNDGVAFRYNLLKSMPMAELFISDETTEFALGRPVPERASLPFRTEQPGVAWLEISELGVSGFPKMSLGRSADNVLVSRLTTIPGNHGYLFAGRTPFTGPWRTIGIAPSPERLRTDLWPSRLAK